MLLYIHFLIQISFFRIQIAKSMSVMNKHAYFMDDKETEAEVADLIAVKSYVPDDRDLPKATVIKSVDNDATYVLSKLSDEQLMKLLSEQPKKNEYYLSDIINLAVGSAPKEETKIMTTVVQDKSSTMNNIVETPNKLKNRFSTIGNKDKAQPAFFRLENREVDPLNINNEASYAAMQKLNSLLNYRLQREDKSEEDEEKKEMLFDVLVAQLKTLCCKKSGKKRRKPLYKYTNQIIQSKNPMSKPYISDFKSQFPNEFMFLILNEEIKGNGSEELISVDPESLEKNSSVLLLGPITTPLSDNQLKVVMTRISNELSKPEYIPFLHQLSEGAVSGSGNMMRNVLNGPLTRRYIKPHRCNHQSKLARVYGGPKWLICTGYININTPSLYD